VSPAGFDFGRQKAIATRSRTSFKKRQKEIARMEKQRDKAAKRMQRKLARQEGPSTAHEAETGGFTEPADETTGISK